MNAQDADLSFPILAFADRDVWGIPTLDVFTQCGGQTIKRNVQAGMDIVDSNGRRFVVQSFWKIGRVGGLMSWATGALFSTPQYRIEHDLAPAPPSALPDTLERVCRTIADWEDIWSDQGDESGDLTPLYAKVRGAASIADLIDRIGLDDFRAL